MTSITVYAVWTLEDQDNVDLFLDRDEANELYEEYEEYGRWEEQEFIITRRDE